MIADAKCSMMAIHPNCWAAAWVDILKQGNYFGGFLPGVHVRAGHLQDASSFGHVSFSRPSPKMEGPQLLL